MKYLVGRWVLVLGFWMGINAKLSAANELPGTAPWTATGDLGLGMVDGIHRWLDHATAATPIDRAKFWNVLPPSKNGAPAPDVKWFAHRYDSNRVRLREQLGLRDPRTAPTLRFLSPAKGVDPSPNPVEIARGQGFRAYAVEWEVLRDVRSEGLLLLPDNPPLADVIAIPDCEQTPEQISGLAPGLPPTQQFARLLAEQGCRVLVPALIDRTSANAGNPDYRRVQHSQRETLWRASWELGRTPTAYELHKIFAAADWLEATRPPDRQPPATDDPAAYNGVRQPGRDFRSLGVFGYGEGGRLAYLAAATDTRFAATYVSGYFGPREELWAEPIDRDIQGMLTEFGDAEIGALIAPRALWLEIGKYPTGDYTDAHGGAPGRLLAPPAAAVTAEHERLQRLVGEVSEYLLHAEPDRFAEHTSRFLLALTGRNPGVGFQAGPSPQIVGALPDNALRQTRLYRQILADTQRLMNESADVRRVFWKKADRSDLAHFTNSVGSYRDHFRTQTVGEIPAPSLPPNPRSRFLGETNGVRRYEIQLDVHPDVFAYGILCVPADLKPGERRPVVVCQHGLEGRPTDVSDPAIESQYYHTYGVRLAERGFVTFAPQNPYIGQTHFRQLVRKAHPLGLNLWSFIVRQHEVITDWLAAQPFVDPTRIGFYGLSYGGKTAMRIPALVNRYALSICSADYNEWIWKNVSATSPYSYLWTVEYDMVEWDLANTFNYAELSWLISPRPFMVERGHDDGVAPDEWVAAEFAKTRRHYVKLGIGDRTEIEFFDGPHSIHGVGTYDFLQRHLQWRKP